MYRLLMLLFSCVLIPATGHTNDNQLWQNSTLNQIIKRGELRVGLEPGFAPFEMINQKGELVGFDVDIARDMAKAMGVKLKIVKLDWNGILPALLTNQFDIIMSGMTITPERNLFINFADPYLTVGQTFVIKRGLRKRIKTFKNLDHPKYTLTTKPGTTALAAIKRLAPKASVRLYESEWAAVREVAEGRADAFVYDSPFVAIAYQKHKKSLVLKDRPLTHERIGWGIRKGDPDFLNWLNHFLAQMKGDGRFEAHYKRWFEGSDWMNEVDLQ